MSAYPVDTATLWDLLADVAAHEHQHEEPYLPKLTGPEMEDLLRPRCSGCRDICPADACAACGHQRPAVWLDAGEHSMPLCDGCHRLLLSLRQPGAPQLVYLGRLPRVPSPAVADPQHRCAAVKTHQLGLFDEDAAAVA